MKISSLPSRSPWLLGLLVAVPSLFPGIGLAQEKPRFVRGDANSDEKVDIGDPIGIIVSLFAEDTLRCHEPADSNDDSRIDIVDPVYLLEYLFLDSAPPPPPFPVCGEPETASELGCEESPCPAPAECPIAVHGCMVMGVECPVFRTDDGLTYEVHSALPIGWCGSITAEPIKGMFSFCMQGPIVRLCSAEADKPGDCPLTIHGKAVEGVECVVFQSDEGEVYELVGGPEEVRKIGWSGTVKAKPRGDLASFCMQGPIVEVCSAEPDPATALK